VSALKLCTTCGAEYPANERFCPRDGTALRSQDTGADLIGSIIADRYHVIRKLGEGGMGQVYLAEHVKMGRKSAVKVMNPMMVQDADAISRFNREAANASRINHQHVAGIYDFGETKEGLIYLAMEYVEGEPLTDMVEKLGALPPARAAELTRQTGEALAVAHEMGIVHRDLKPDNVMVAKLRDGSDCVKVVDFGIAKAAGVDSQKVTRTGLVVGTPEYMSPEQLSGDPLDGRSDIYSLGLVAFHMLTGSIPFPSNTVQESMIMRLTDQPQRLSVSRPEVPWTPEVQAVMDKALQRDASLRYQSASEFGRALVAAVKAMPKEIPPTKVSAAATPSERLGGLTTQIPITRISSLGLTPSVPAAPVPATSRRMPILIGAAVTVLALVGGWMVFSSGRGSPKETQTASQPVAPPRSTPAAVAPAASSPLPAPIDSASFASVSTITSSDVATMRPRSSPSDAVPDPSAGAASPATGSPTVTGAAAGQSYEADLLKLAARVKDSLSALQVRAEIPAWRGRVTLARDRAILQVIEADIAANRNMDEQACALWRKVDRNDLGERLNHTYAAMKQSCEGS
jgi:eukaryotic-like serine/threonine-protein kinase